MDKESWRTILEEEYGRAPAEIMDGIEELSALPVERQLRLIWTALAAIFNAHPPGGEAS